MRQVQPAAWKALEGEPAWLSFCLQNKSRGGVCKPEVGFPLAGPNLPWNLLGLSVGIGEVDAAQLGC